jgi:hypothetical protein
VRLRLRARGGFAPDDPLQRFGHVRVEATSFTVSEPTAEATVAPAVYERATGQERSVLSGKFGVAPFAIRTIRIERIFVDKVFASEFYYGRRMHLDAAKHLYDVAATRGLGPVGAMLSDRAALAEMVGHKRREESARIGSDLSGRPFSEFSMVRGMRGDGRLEGAFGRMQDVYVHDDSHKIGYRAACDALEAVMSAMLGLDR